MNQNSKTLLFFISLIALIVICIIGGFFLAIRIDSKILTLFVFISSFIVLVWVIGNAVYRLVNWWFARLNDFHKLKPEEYNKSAKEAFAKSLIDLSTSITKGISFTLYVLPLTLILKRKFGTKTPRKPLPPIIK